MNKVITFLFLILVNFAFSQKTYIKEYRYNASEKDSKLDARYSALTEMKRQLIEEIGVLVSTKTDLYNKNGESDIEIKTKVISEGITKTKIIDEKWDGYIYYIKAEITIDEDGIIKRLNRINIDYNDVYKEDYDNRSNINNHNSVINKKNNKTGDIYYGKFSLGYQNNNDFLLGGITFGIISYEMYDIGLYGRYALSDIGEKDYYDYGMVFGISKKVGRFMIDVPIRIGTGNITINEEEYIDESNYMVIVNPSIDVGVGLGDGFYLMGSIGYKYVNYKDYNNIDYNLDGVIISLYLKKIK